MNIVPAVDVDGLPIPEMFVVLDENGDEVFGPASKEECKEFVRKRKNQPEPPAPGKPF